MAKNITSHFGECTERKKLPTIDVCTYIAELHISQCISKATSCYIFHVCIHHFYVLLICEAQQFFFIVHLHPIFLDHKKAVFTFNFLCASTAYFLTHTPQREFFYYMSSHFSTHNFLCLYPSWQQQQKKFFFHFTFHNWQKNVWNGNKFF